MVALTWLASGLGTAMHLASQSTSPALHASRQARVEACAGSVLAAVAATDEEAVVLWALASMARAPATTMLVKRILNDLSEPRGVIKLRRW